MNDEEILFNSKQELYERLRPALLTKENELKRSGYDYITEKDIWNYLAEKEWKQAKDLRIDEMVDDIFRIDETLLDAYLKTKFNSRIRKIYFE